MNEQKWERFSIPEKFNDMFIRMERLIAITEVRRTGLTILKKILFIFILNGI